MAKSMVVIVKDPVQERNEVLYRLELAVNLLESSMNPLFLGEGKANLAFAVKGARDGNGVAAVPGGIVVKDGKVTRQDPCAFDADGDAARIVLTAIKCDPNIRSAAILGFSDKMLGVFEAMLLECAPIQNLSKSAAISTMDWDVASCCADGVPDIIYNRKGDRKPAVLYIFGEDPVVVANNIIICSNRI